ncbi:MAG: oxygen-dependent coproporphyrinogen oxidase [Flavobacteriaceae bacterium]|jgi:coproporphyrinogen III oxidase|nr:oxygen-dependent coproporphyrinogen oxidase [Flavobacteriaceae bacterium]
MKNVFSKYIDSLQASVISSLEQVDGLGKFKKDSWSRIEGGGGLTMVLENGNVFEKGGVNVSKVHGKLPESMSTMLNTKDSDFYACGISIVLHPKNPMVPTFHANLRYFELYNNGALKDRWFGGGLDLTPYYIFENDVIHFHANCKSSCDKYDLSFYNNYKKKCDEYFWNSHRNEARGVGGLFFDYCRENNEMSVDKWFSFIKEMGQCILNSYIPIVEKRKNETFNELNVNWQQIRRGRYVEFNLLHDKGTLFGLKTKGRIESILISMPPKVKWAYDFNPAKDSNEEKLVKILESPKNWV